MRALCGSIIAAGGLIGLGLTALGYGIRFQNYGPDAVNKLSDQLYGIPTLILIMVVLIIGLLIGITVTFIGLAYHHERRYYEEEYRKGNLKSSIPS